MEYVFEEEKCDVGITIKNVTTSDVLPSHLHAIFEASSEKMNDDEKKQLRMVLIKYQNVFSKDSKDLEVKNLVEHRINTGDAAPIRQPPRRIPLAKMKEAEEEIKDMASRGIIEPSNSPWSSPVMLVRKKDGSTRFCVDYRKLNDVTIKDSHPLPRIDDTLDALSGAKLFSTLDLKSRYWQVKVTEKSLKLHFQFLVVACGSLQ